MSGAKTGSVLVWARGWETRFNYRSASSESASGFNGGRMASVSSATPRSFIQAEATRLALQPQTPTREGGALAHCW
jgi:hypothetical protein